MPVNRLAGKTAIVTGGGSGIGLATARLFEQEGAHVVVFDIDVAGTDPELHPVRVDVRSPNEVEAAIQQVVQNHRRLDVLVNVAGGSGRKWGDGPADACSLEGWEKTLALNLDSVFYCCKYGLQAMLPEGPGSIVNISSVLGLVGGDEDFATHAYASSKGAVISLTRSIASYYAARNIRANVICPGLIATRMSERAQENERIRARMSQLQPLTGDFGSPQDVAQAALYLASDESAFVTGSVLTVDGGWTVR
jgi:NAD(P)-dependent dehydrogenase (short-subunit alcohol dehydrogenase family)